MPYLNTLGDSESDAASQEPALLNHFCGMAGVVNLKLGKPGIRSQRTEHLPLFAGCISASVLKLAKLPPLVAADQNGMSGFSLGCTRMSACRWSRTDVSPARGSFQFWNREDLQ